MFDCVLAVILNEVKDLLFVDKGKSRFFARSLARDSAGRSE